MLSRTDIFYFHSFKKEAVTEQRAPTQDKDRVSAEGRGDIPTPLCLINEDLEEK